MSTTDRRAAMRAALTGMKAKAPKPYRILNATASEAEIRIYDEIAWYAVNAEELAQELAQITAPTIHLRVNSPGGSVFDGLAIYNQLQAHPARVITHVDGIAASIASVIALAGDEVHMAPGAFAMIHNPWSLVVGDAAAMRQEADVLDKVAGSLAGIYAARTGQSVDAMRALMDAETWWTGEDAKEAGYATHVAEVPPATEAAAQARFDLSLFAKVPDVLRAAASGAPRAVPDNPRDLEELLRDVCGFSNAQAKRLVAGGFKALTEPRDESRETSADLAPLADIAADLSSLLLSR